MEAAGIESGADFAATTDNDSLSEYPEQPRAANALHGCDAGCPYTSRIDAELQMVMEAWNTLPAAIRAAVVALVASQERAAE